jgi:hypothetical protein
MVSTFADEAGTSITRLRSIDTRRSSLNKQANAAETKAHHRITTAEPIGH